MKKWVLKDMIDKSKDQPKLLYSYIKSKSQVKGKTQSTVDKGKNYVKEKEKFNKVLNKSFW